MKEIPFLAIGNDELGELVAEKVQCKFCPEVHEVEYGKQVLEDGTEIESKTIGFVKCPLKENGYMVAVDGRLILGWRNA